MLLVVITVVVTVIITDCCHGDCYKILNKVSLSVTKKKNVSPKPRKSRLSARQGWAGSPQGPQVQPSRGIPQGPQSPAQVPREALTLTPQAQVCVISTMPSTCGEAQRREAVGH